MASTTTIVIIIIIIIIVIAAIIGLIVYFVDKNKTKTPEKIPIPPIPPSKSGTRTEAGTGAGTGTGTGTGAGTGTGTGAGTGTGTGTGTGAGTTTTRSPDPVISTTMKHGDIVNIISNKTQNFLTKCTDENFYTTSSSGGSFFTLRISGGSNGTPINMAGTSVELVNIDTKNILNATFAEEQPTFSEDFKLSDINDPIEGGDPDAPVVVGNYYLEDGNSNQSSISSFVIANFLHDGKAPKYGDIVKIQYNKLELSHFAKNNLVSNTFSPFNPDKGTHIGFASIEGRSSCDGEDLVFISPEPSSNSNWIFKHIQNTTTG